MTINRNWLGGGRRSGAQSPPLVMQGRAQRESRWIQPGPDDMDEGLDGSGLVWAVAWALFLTGLGTMPCWGRYVFERWLT